MKILFAATVLLAASLGTAIAAPTRTPRNDCVLQQFLELHNGNESAVDVAMAMAFDRIGIGGVVSTMPGLDEPVGAGETKIDRKIAEISIHHAADVCTDKFRWKPQQRRTGVLVAYAQLAQDQANRTLSRWFSFERDKYYNENKAAFTTDAGFTDAVMGAARKLAPGGKQPPKSELNALAMYFLTTRELAKLRPQFGR